MKDFEERRYSPEEIFADYATEFYPFYRFTETAEGKKLSRKDFMAIWEAEAGEKGPVLTFAERCKQKYPYFMPTGDFKKEKIEELDSLVANINSLVKDFFTNESKDENADVSEETVVVTERLREWAQKAIAIIKTPEINSEIMAKAEQAFRTEYTDEFMGMYVHVEPLKTDSTGVALQAFRTWYKDAKSKRDGVAVLKFHEKFNSLPVPEKYKEEIAEIDTLVEDLNIWLDQFARNQTGADIDEPLRLIKRVNEIIESARPANKTNK